jgi:hypothetical protein
MALEIDDLVKIMSLIKLIPRSNRNRILFIGDTKIIANYKDLYRSSESVGFELLGSTGSITNLTFGTMCGFSQTDTLGLENCSISHNLMDDPPIELLQKFDLIIDAGVLFWLFNPGTALMNLVKMTSEGGYIIHLTALTGHFGTGWYNLHPRLFFDFYESNGFRALDGGWFRFRNTSLLQIAFNKTAKVVCKQNRTSNYRRIRDPRSTDLDLLMMSKFSRLLSILQIRDPKLHCRIVGMFYFKKDLLIKEITLPILLEKDVAKVNRSPHKVDYWNVRSPNLS